MAMLTIRNIDESLKAQLRVRAAENGCSMEEEVRRILKKALAANDNTKTGLATHIRHRLKKLGIGHDEPELPERTEPRPAPDFSEH